MGQWRVARQIQAIEAGGDDVDDGALALESTGDKQKVLEFGRQICMHIAATPTTLVVNQEELSKDIIDKERAIYVEQAKAALWRASQSLVRSSGLVVQVNGPPPSSAATCFAS